MSDFNQVMSQSDAELEIRGLLAKKKIFPKQIERLQPAIEQVAEAMSYGLVTIGDDGSITQKLLSPVNGKEEITYAARIAPIEVNKALQNLKVTNQTNINLTYLKMYSKEMETTFLNMEPSDRTTAESIAFFFQ